MAGGAKVDITPTDLTGLTNLWRTPFEGVHDPIFVRALVVDNGINCAAIVAADLVEFGDTLELRKQIEHELSIPVQNIIITASHDHNAPRVGSITPGATAQKGGPATEKYTEFVYGCILNALREAKLKMQPAKVGIGKGASDINTSRDIYTAEGWKLGVNPEGPSDKTVWVTKFETETGEPIAILMNYAVHSVVVGPKNTLVTGDLAGAAERYVEKYYDETVVALWTMGAAGDQNPKYICHDETLEQVSKRPDDYTLMDTFGQVLGEEVIHAEKQIEKMNSEACIEAAEKIIFCPARMPKRDSNKVGMEVEKVNSLNIRIGILLINQIAFTWVSGEVVTNLYWQLKKESPLSNTMMITITNDRVGYIVDDAAYDIPTFASAATPFQRGYAEQGIVNGLIEMITKFLC